jgi:hypothetical protein
VDNQIKPVESLDMPLGSGKFTIHATLDGLVKIAIAGAREVVTLGLDPKGAEQAAAQLREAAHVARHIQTLTALAPKDLDENGMIEYLQQAFATTPMPKKGKK